MDKQTAGQLLASDLVELKIQYQPHCVVEFSVKAHPTLVKAAHKEAIRSLAKETTIPGFRKGKAPDALILKHFASDVKKRWQQNIAEDAFYEAEKLAQIPVLNSGSRVGFTMIRYNLEEGAEITFHFETEPQAPTVDCTQLSLQKEPEIAIDQNKVDETLHKIRLFFAKWQPIVDRGVQLGDFIVVDLDAIEDDEPVRVVSASRLEVNESDMAEWMRAMVMGMTAGESKEGVSQPDADASEEDKMRFKPKKVVVTLKSIEEPILPPVDDAFANKLGAESASVMLERLRMLLQKQEEQTQKAKYRDQLTDLLLEKYPFDVPASLLKTEIGYRVQHVMKTPEFRRMTDEAKQQKFTKIATQAEEALRLFYLCRKVALDHRLTVQLSELQEEALTLLDAMFADKELSNPNKTEEQKDLLMSRILLEKAQDFILDQILR